MKNITGKTKIKYFSKIISPAIKTAILIYLVITTVGCNQPQEGLSDTFDFSNPNSLQTQAFGIIRNALSDSEPLARVNAIEVVATTGQIRLMPRVQSMVNDEAAPVRFAVALAIGDMQYTIAKNSVAQLLRDNDPSVIIAAAYAMNRLGSTEYNEVLRQAIYNENPVVKANAALLLGKIGDKNALKQLYWALYDSNSDDRVVYQAAESIARLGDEGIYQKLWSMLISAYADVRVSGVRAMGMLGTRKSREALISMLDDPILEVRLAAAAQLGKYGDDLGEPEVLDVFEKNLMTGLDGEAITRVNVLTSLAIGQICTPNLIKFLPNLLKNESKYVRIAAAKAVLQCGVN